MYLRSSCYADITEDTWQAEHILCLEETTVWRTINLYCYLVLSLSDIRGNIELCRIAWVLWEAYVTTVDPQIEEWVYTIKVEIDFLTVPSSRDVKTSSKRTYLITIFVSGVVLWRFTHNTLLPVARFDVIFENNPLIHIDWHTILQCSIFLNTCHIPAYWHLQTVPLAVFITLCEEVFWTFIGVLWEVETPFSVKRKVILSKLW